MSVLTENSHEFVGVSCFEIPAAKKNNTEGEKEIYIDVIAWGFKGIPGKN